MEMGLPENEEMAEGGIATISTPRIGKNQIICSEILIMSKTLMSTPFFVTWILMLKGAIQIICHILWDGGRFTGQCIQMPQLGGRGLTKVSFDIFPKF